MRKIIAAAALLAVTSAHAEKLKFGDLNYFFKQGQFNAMANVNQVFEKADTLGTMLETRGVVTTTQFTYAINDQFSAFVGLDYAYDLQTETTGNPDSDNDGLANPAVGATYRLINQSSTAYNVDLGAVARFGIEDAERGAAGEDGNFANGRNSLEVLAKMGRKWNEANEWQLAAGAIYFQDGESTTVTPVADIDQDDDSSLDFYLRAAYQYRPVHEFMVLLSAQANRIGEFNSDASGSKTERDSHIDMDFRFMAKYLLTESTIVNFNYGQSRNSDYDVTAAGSNLEVNERRENFYGLGVDFLF